ncbi:hypothetical protein VTI74DRAFT_2228 [Chaetomium olivicolor]
MPFKKNKKTSRLTAVVAARATKAANRRQDQAEEDGNLLLGDETDFFGLSDPLEIDPSFNSDFPLGDEPNTTHNSGRKPKKKKKKMSTSTSSLGGEKRPRGPSFPPSTPSPPPKRSRKEEEKEEKEDGKDDPAMRKVPCRGFLKSALVGQSRGDCLESDDPKEARCVRCLKGRKTFQPCPPDLVKKACTFLQAKSDPNSKPTEVAIQRVSLRLDLNDHEKDEARGLITISFAAAAADPLSLGFGSPIPLVIPPSISRTPLSTPAPGSSACKGSSRVQRCVPLEAGASKREEGEKKKKKRAKEIAAVITAAVASSVGPAVAGALEKIL